MRAATRRAARRNADAKFLATKIFIRWNYDAAVVNNENWRGTIRSCEKFTLRIGGIRGEKSISLTWVDIGAAFREIVVAPLILGRSPRDLKRRTAKWCGTCRRKNHLDIFSRSGDIKSRYLICAWTRVIAYRVCAAFLPLSRAKWNFPRRRDPGDLGVGIDISRWDHRFRSCLETTRLPANSIGFYFPPGNSIGRTWTRLVEPQHDSSLVFILDRAILSFFLSLSRDLLPATTRLKVISKRESLTSVFNF